MYEAIQNRTVSTRLARLRELCETLPEVRVEPAGTQHFALRVGKKTFAWYLNNHHGDGVISLCAKSTLARQRELIARDPARFFFPQYVGAKGWVGLRLDTSKLDWGAVLDLLVAAYRLQAPRKLLAQLD
jgi:hypothetical protein